MSQRLKAGEAVIELRRQEGVSQIFGIVGSSFLDILDPLYDRDDIRFIGVRHEQGAALMADGPSIIEIPIDPDELPRPARMSDVEGPNDST